MLRDDAYWKAVETTVDQAPPLSEVQRAKIANALRPVARATRGGRNRRRAVAA